MAEVAETLLISNIKLLATFSAHGDIADAAIYVRGPEIEWVGRADEIPDVYSRATTMLDLAECVVIPGTLDWVKLAGDLQRSVECRRVQPNNPRTDLHPICLVAVLRHQAALLSTCSTFAGLVNSHHHMFQVGITT